MAQALQSKFDEVEKETDPFSTATTVEETSSRVRPLKPTGRRLASGANPGADAIFSQHARISSAFSEAPEPVVEPYPPAVRLAIVVGGAGGLWAFLFWGAALALKALV